MLTRKIVIGFLSSFLALGGCSDNRNTAPTAILTGPQQARVLVPVEFDASASSDIESAIKTYSFTFGDESEAVKGVSKATHRFEKAGDYVVTVTVTDAEGAVSRAKAEITITDNIPPAASFSGPLVAGVGQSLTFDGTGSSDSDGAIAAYKFDFGDGSAAGTNSISTHTYAKPGNFVVSLTVTDDNDAETTVKRAVKIQAIADSAPLALAHLDAPANARALDTVNFDASRSISPDGKPQYKIYFGDGSSATGRSVNHRFAMGGDYTAMLMLIVTYADGSTNVTMDAQDIHIVALNTANASPSAAFTGAASARFGASVAFDGVGSRAPGATSVMYNWDLGDGSAPSGLLVTHAYATGGLYLVRLLVTATYADGTTGVSQASNVIRIEPNALPVARIAAPASALSSDLVTVDALASSDADGSTLTSVDFGDGTIIPLQVASHAYAAAGTYTIVVTVTDNDGAVSTASRVISIRNYNQSVAQPVALLSGPASLGVDAPATFTLAGSTAPGASSVSYRIDFSDGSVVAAQTVSHAYANNGGYVITASLTATYPDGTTNFAATNLAVQVHYAYENSLATVSLDLPVNARFGTVSLGSTLSAAGSTGHDTYWNLYQDVPPYNSYGVSGDDIVQVFSQLDAGIWYADVSVDVYYADGYDNTVYGYAPFVIVGNQAPVAALTGATSGLVGDALFFDATGSSDADGALVLTVIEFGDGWATTAPAASHTYAAPGTYAVTAKVFDNDGAMASTTRLVTLRSVASTYPLPTIALAGPSMLTVNQIGVFTTSGSQAPGASSVTISFDFGDASPFLYGNAVTHSFSADGVFTVSALLKATYSDGSTSSVTALLPVDVKTGNSANPAPVASFTAPASVRSTSPVLVDAGASAAPGATSIAYNWNFGDGNTASGATAIHTYAALTGTFPIHLTVVGTYSDGTTSFSQSAKLVALVANALPYVNFTGPTHTIVGQSVSFDSTSSSDSDGAIASRVFDFGDAATSGNIVASHTYATAGTYEVLLTLTDNDGGTSFMVRDIRVLTAAEAGNTPVARLVAPSIGLPSAIVTLDGSGSTAETGYLTTFFWDLGDGRSFAGASAINVTYATRGLYTVALMVTNSTGLSNRIERQVSILNSAPVLASASLNAGPHYETSLIQVTPSGWFDADGDAPQYRYRWAVDGVEVVGETGSTLTGLSFSKGATVQAEVAPYDGYNYGTRVWSNITTIANSAPSIASADLNGTAFTESGTIIVTPNGWGDADGDAANHTYQWYVDGFMLFGATTNSLIGTAFNKGSSVYVVVTPDDLDVSGNNTGTPVNSVTVTINNTPPTMTSAGIAAATYTESSVISVTPVGGADVDGADTVTYQYQWYVNAVPVVGQTGSSLTGTYFSKGDSVAAQVAPFDGSALGAPVNSNAVVISNSAPTIASVDFGTGPFYKNDTLTAAAFGLADADAADTATVQYRWYVNGAFVSAAASINAGFAKGDTVTVGAAAFDGTASSAWVIAPITTIQNRKPVLDSLTITPASAFETSTLSISAITSHDDDFDTVTYQYMWYVNGSATGVTATTLSGANFSHFDAVSLRVTPFDGTDVGSYMTSNAVFIQNTVPTAPGITYDPLSFNTGDDLSITVSAASTDADPADTVSYSYTWYKNGVDQLFAAGTTVVLNALLKSGETWKIVVTPNDTYGNGATAWSQKVIPQTFIPTTNPMAFTKAFHTATTLPSGKVLIVGASSSALLYDPGTDGFSATSGAPNRSGHTATLLPNGKVLIAGGRAGSPLLTAEIYDPGTDTFTATLNPMGTPRANHTATLLPNGLVLIAGGAVDASSTASATAELYDPVADTFTPSLFTMGAARRSHTATLLPNGLVLIAGGRNVFVQGSAELYDPAFDTFTPTLGSLGAGRYLHTATLLPNGMVLLAGGEDSSLNAVASAELYNPGSDSFAATGSLSASREMHTATLLPNGLVLMTGGWVPSTNTYLASAELYDSTTGTFAPTTGSMGTARDGHTASLLSNGKVLITGGNSWGAYVSSAELYR